MPTMKHLKIDSLSLDLNNFRTIHQKNEFHAINAMISISPDKFWALLESLIDDGYHPTESIILQETDGKIIVKEGNRRIAALKIIYGYEKKIDVPESIKRKIQALTDDWKKANINVPCTIYKSSESETVDKIISLIHAKGEKASRDQWTAVARARYDRDQKGLSESGLDLLEKYLKNGKNLSENQIERWSGDYPLTVLDEAIQKLGFKDIRDKNDFFGNKYGMKVGASTSSSSTSSSQTNPANKTSTKPSTSTPSSPIAQASNDPKSVSRKLKSFQPKGNGREKLVTLLNELRKLRIKDHPHSFCFLLRSMFEISAKLYCADCKSIGGPSAKKKDGSEKALADLLRDITTFITKNNTDKDKVKLLHGAITEIAKKDGVLSVTSMNQLVHNPSFSISPNDICILFGNIFPLLGEMNQ